MISALRNICIFICQAKTWEFKWENPKPIHSWYACSSRSSFFAKCTKKVREKWLETLIMNCIKRSRIFSTHNHGLRTPNEAFFHWNSKLLGLGRQIGVFGVLSAELSAPILVQWVPCQCFPLFNHYFYKKLSLYIHIRNKYLGLGFEFGPQRIRNLAFVCP